MNNYNIAHNHKLGIKTSITCRILLEVVSKRERERSSEKVDTYFGPPPPPASPKIPRKGVMEKLLIAKG